MDNKKIISIYTTVLSIITVLAIIFGLYRLGHNFSLFGSKDKVSDAQTVNVDQFKNIEADVDVAELKITYGDNYSVSYECNSSNSDIVPKISVDNGTLTVNQKMHNLISSGVGVNTDSCSIKITVPKDAALEKIIITSDVGDITIEGDSSLLNASYIDVTTDVGESLIKYVTADTITCNSDVGEIDISNSAVNTIKLKSDVGEINVEDTTAEKVSANSSVGDINVDNVYTANGSKPDFDLDTDIGDVKVDY